MGGETIYEIRLQGQLGDHWADWFGGLAITRTGSAETILSGPLVDQAALFGVLNQIQALNLTLISIHRIEG